MTSISEIIRHYQRSIDRSVKDEARVSMQPVFDDDTVAFITL